MIVDSEELLHDIGLHAKAAGYGSPATLGRADQ
jgi:hypothetical protein